MSSDRGPLKQPRVSVLDCASPLALWVLGAGAGKKTGHHARAWPRKVAKRLGLRQSSGALDFERRRWQRKRDTMPERGLERSRSVLDCASPLALWILDAGAGKGNVTGCQSAAPKSREAFGVRRIPPLSGFAKKKPTVHRVPKSAEYLLLTRISASPAGRKKIAHRFIGGYHRQSARGLALSKSFH